jgi:cell division protein FtsQ
MTESRVVVDPRMRSRRIEVQRGAGRRRLRRALTAVGTLAVLAAAYVAVHSPLLDVDHVRVSGGEHTDPAAVAVASGVPRGAPLVTLDTGAVARRVEALPWVRTARVERRWPGTIGIAISERRPAATMPAGEGRTALVDATGRVLAVVDAGTAGAALPPGLPAVTGAGGHPQAGDTLGPRARRAVEVARAVGESLPGTVTEVSTDLDATLVSGGKVRFGSVDDLDEKIVAVETVLTDVDVACLKVLDVRVPGSPILTRNGGCS